MTSSNRNIFSVTVPLCVETTGQSGFSSQRESNAGLWCFCCQSEKSCWTNILDWPVFRDAIKVIWRHRNVLKSQYGGCWWPDAYLAPRHLKPSWRNRTVAYLSSCILFRKIAPWYQLLCGSGHVTQCKKLHFLRFLWLHRCIVCNDCNAVYSRLVLFLWSVIECHQFR